jgi:hypothetical protein
MSGWYRATRPTVESLWRLDILQLLRDCPRLRGVVEMTRGTIDMIQTSAVEVQWVSRGWDLNIRVAHPPHSGASYSSIEVEQTRCNFGGSRTWFRCPTRSCARRCRFLYMAAKAIVCRVCGRLPYASQRHHRDSGWESGTAMARLPKLRRRLSLARTPRSRAKIGRLIEYAEAPVRQFIAIAEAFMGPSPYA